MRDIDKQAKPTVHLNGSSRESLSSGYEKAANAVQAAMDALSETAPNARDYYVQSGKGAGSHATPFDQAVAEYTYRMAALQRVYDELAALWESVQA